MGTGYSSHKKTEWIRLSHLENCILSIREQGIDQFLRLVSALQKEKSVFILTDHIDSGMDY